MAKIRYESKCFSAYVCCLLAVTSSAVATDVATKVATYVWYYDYALNPALPLLNQSIATATKEFCAYLCTTRANCFATTLLKANKTCLFLTSCGHAVLLRSNNTVTAALSTMPAIRNRFPTIHLPLTNECNGLLNQLGSGPLSANPGFNKQELIANFVTDLPASPTVIRYQTSTADLSNTGYVYFQDTLNGSLDLFSSGGSYSIAFMIRPNSLQLPQSILGLTADYMKPNCLHVVMQDCGYPCLNIAYFALCDGWSSNGPQFDFSFPVILNVNQHVAVTYDAMSKIFTGYVDGIVYSTQSVSPASTKTSYLVIGNTRTMTYSFGGSLFCLQLFKLSLTKAEVSALSQLCRTGGVVL